MKKTTVILLTLAILLTLPACSLTFLNKTVNTGQDDKPDEPPVQSQEPSVPDPAPTQPDDTPSSLLPDPDQTDDAVPDVGEPDTPEEEKPEEAEAIKLSNTDVTLRSEGESFTLKLQNVPGIYAATFTSDDPEIASVDEMTGLVTAVAPGNTKIKVHLEGDGVQRDFECIIRCVWKGEEASQPASGTASSRPALSSFFSTLQGSYEGLGAMMVMDGELLENYYPGLSDIASVEEVLIQETMISMSNVAVGLVKLSDDASLDDVIAVQNVLQTRIDTQANGGAFYPDSCDTWKAGVITSVSNCVGMFVCPEYAENMANDFIVAFSN